MAAPTILWIRKDFRLSENRALATALEGGGPVIPVFILDEVIEAYGAAPKWRLSRAIDTFSAALAEKGSRLILRRGDALSVLHKLIKETGAKRVVWGRQYDKAAKERDTGVKSALKDDGLDAIIVSNHLLFEPWEIETKSGGPYKVYTPFKNTCFDRADFPSPLSPPSKIPAPETWPDSDTLADWGLEAAMDRGAGIVSQYARVGEKAARARLGAFLKKIDDYNEARDRPDEDGTSGLSENLAWGEISPLMIWHSVREAPHGNNKGATVFLQEIVWREFAYHLLHHFPGIDTENWRAGWENFPWRDDNDEAERWRRGMTGLPFVDAAMRELYATGTMHNRLRMLTASVLTKHLLTDWRVGERWFADCLIDWDPASNAMGWQWVAGCGPDASPFFRIFNPEAQREKFDPKSVYVENWVAECAKGHISKDARNFFAAMPRSWSMDASQNYPEPIVGLKVRREKALEAYQKVKKSS